MDPTKNARAGSAGHSDKSVGGRFKGGRAEVFFERLSDCGLKQLADYALRSALLAQIGSTAIRHNRISLRLMPASCGGGCNESSSRAPGSLDTCFRVRSRSSAIFCCLLRERREFGQIFKRQADLYGPLRVPLTRFFAGPVLHCPSHQSVSKFPSAPLEASVESGFKPSYQVFVKLPG